jgi:hypothetical protein
VHNLTTLQSYHWEPPYEIQKGNMKSEILNPTQAEPNLNGRKVKQFSTLVSQNSTTYAILGAQALAEAKLGAEA